MLSVSFQRQSHSGYLPLKPLVSLSKIFSVLFTLFELMGQLSDSALDNDELALELFLSGALDFFNKGLPCLHSAVDLPERELPHCVLSEGSLQDEALSPPVLDH